MSDISNLSDLAEKYQSMVLGFDVAPHYKAFNTKPQHDGSPHIEAADGKFQYVVTERGAECERISNLSADDVLYRLFLSVTMHMATKYELRNRVPGTDGRAVWFPHQESLMASLDPVWGQRLRDEHLRVLDNHPLRS